MDKEVAEGLAPLFERARREKLLFRSHYQHVLFTPDALEQTQKDGQFRWGAVNWELVKAEDVRADKMRNIDRLLKEVDDFDKKFDEFLPVEIRNRVAGNTR